MATTTNDEREDSIRHVLARVNEDLRQHVPADVQYGTPPDFRHPPAAATNTELVGAGDGAAETIMRGVEEAEKKAAHLRHSAEHFIKQLRAWSDEFALQQAQLVNYCDSLEAVASEHVERITQIGTKPAGGNGRHE